MGGCQFAKRFFIGFHFFSVQWASEEHSVYYSTDGSNFTAPQEMCQDWICVVFECLVTVREEEEMDLSHTNDLFSICKPPSIVHLVHLDRHLRRRRRRLFPCLSIPGAGGLPSDRGGEDASGKINFKDTHSPGFNPSVISVGLVLG